MEPVTIACAFEGCAAQFSPSREWQRFCSSKCRMDHANGRRREGLKLLERMQGAPLELAGATS